MKELKGYIEKDEIVDFLVELQAHEKDIKEKKKIDGFLAYIENCMVCYELQPVEHSFWWEWAKSNYHCANCKAESDKELDFCPVCHCKMDRTLSFHAYLEDIQRF